MRRVKLLGACLVALAVLPGAALAQPAQPYEAPNEELWRSLKLETEEIPMSGRARDQLRALLLQVEQTARQQALMKKSIVPPKQGVAP